MQIDRMHVSLPAETARRLGALLPGPTRTE